jgi:hypothetical protein
MPARLLLDFCDLYAFPEPGDATKSAVIKPAASLDHVPSSARNPSAPLLDDVDAAAASVAITPE